MGSLCVIASRSGPPDGEAAARMLRAAPHRGGRHEVLVHGRTVLAVANDPDFVDSSLAARDGLVAGFSGTLDNRAELNAELARRGEPVRGDDPASTLLALFRGGPAALVKLRGTFSGAVSDGTRLWCFRDHMGFRGLYFRDHADAFVAGNEPKQVTAGAGIPREPDLDAVERAFWDRLGARETVIKGVERFPRASYCTVENGHTSFSGYWDPSDLVESSRLSVDDATERLTELLDQAVRRTVTGRDAIKLSGGVDSPAVAAFAARPHLERGGRRLTALSSVFPDYPSVDEEPYIRIVSERLDLDLHTQVPRIRPLTDVQHWADALDGPSNVLHIPEMAGFQRWARQLGARTVMTGELAEHVFTQSSHLIGHFILHGRWRPAARYIRAQRRRGKSWRRIGRMVGPSLVPAPVAVRYQHMRPKDRRIGPWLDGGGPPHRYDLALPVRQRWLHFQLLPFQSPAVAWEAIDLCGAATGVHERMPLGDVDLWEFLLSLRAEVKFPDARFKSLFRKSLRGHVPDEILDRRGKTAFDDYAMGEADYEGLDRWLLDPAHRIGGVDYDALGERIRERRLSTFELIWSYDLARVHAFLALWE
jgi:asparagine synthase (glutamine-hydrolysing)